MEARENVVKKAVGGIGVLEDDVEGRQR